MDLNKDLKDVTGLAGRQALGFVEVIKLKLRIIGFSNKKSGLLTKLGELAYKSVDEKTSLADNDDAMKLVEEIRKASHEITTSEEAINKRKEVDHKDREEFQGQRRKTG
ncbi:hypothetical protein MNBD_NITROSPINAE02-1371 [hydrothermal vent metagenome]|uniref:Uncharacterized protein n=1 Tax=hydrothermal vent metagenome TaxID=652676 RepID=A0A3B1CB14_9ZZZZ